MMKVRYKKGDHVQTLSVDGNWSHETYIVAYCGAQIATIVDSNGNEYKAHISRVRLVDEQGGLTMSKPEAEAKAVEIEKPAPPKQPKTKAKAKPKKDKPPKTMTKKTATATATIPKVDIAEIKKDSEVWMKDITEAFNTKNKGKDKVVVKSYCAIAKDGKSFFHFNTYDGTLGRIQEGETIRRKTKDGIKESTKKLGKSYSLKNEKAKDKKIAKLKSVGYKRI